jgi:hypothetical protein
MTGFIIWIIGYGFTSAYENGRRISKHWVWDIVLLCSWPIRLGELFREDFVELEGDKDEG